MNKKPNCIISIIITTFTFFHFNSIAQTVPANQPKPPTYVIGDTLVKSKIDNIKLDNLSTVISVNAIPSIKKELYSTACPAPNKCSALGLYMSSNQAVSAKRELKDKIAFIDVRTYEEINYVGVSKEVDFYVPYVNLDGFHSVDTQRKSLKTVNNPNFLNQVKKAVTLLNLNSESPIILICRSGDRSAKAVDLLSKMGYSQVYTVVDGFEGDLDSNGNRYTNGLKNTSLPWGYVFDIDKLIE